MAFQTTSGYGNLPNGNFSPVIYSKQVQLAFRKSTVVGDITNSDYFGEIANQGDTVRICLLYTSPSPRDVEESRMPSSA